MATKKKKEPTVTATASATTTTTTAPVRTWDASILSDPRSDGFGRTWQLWIAKYGPDGSVLGQNTLWLGQAAKVAARLLGTRMEKLVADSEEACGSDDWDECRFYVTQRVLGALCPDGDYSGLLTAEPWACAVE